MKIFKFIFSLSLFLLTSCTSSSTANKEYVETIYIDYVDDSFSFELYTAPISDYGKNDTNKDAILLSTSGSSIVEAIKLLDNKLENTLDFHHTKSLIIGKNLYENEEKLKSLLETFYEYNDISRRGNIYTTNESFNDIKDILKKDLTLKKLTFYTSISDCLYSLNNYGYFVVNNLEKEGETLVSKKGDLFIDYKFTSTTDENYSLGYFLLTSEEQKELVLDSDFIIKDYKVVDKIKTEGDVIYYDLYIKAKGKYATKENDHRKTEKFIYDKVSTSFDYFRNLSDKFFNIDDEIYKSNLPLYKKYIENKNDFEIVPRFFIEVTE